MSAERPKPSLQKGNRVIFFYDYDGKAYRGTVTDVVNENRVLFKLDRESCERFARANELFPEPKHES